MNNNNKKLGGFALANLALAIALGATLTAGTVLYFHSVQHQENITTDANLIIKQASFTQNQSASSHFVGQTFDAGTTTDGVVSADTDAKTCAQLRAKLSASGSASCSGSGTLTYQNPDKLNALVAVNQSGIVEGTADKVTNTPVSVNMNGSVSVASVVKNMATGSTSSSFKSTGTAIGSGQSLSGNSGGSVSSSFVLGTGSSTVAPISEVGTATVDPPTPAYPAPSAPTVLFSMWGVNVVVSQDNSVDHYKMGVTCGVNPPQNQFDETVQTVPASGLVEGVNTNSSNYYFVPDNVPYTVIGGPYKTSAGTQQVQNMTSALPENLCEMGGGYGGVWAVQVQVQACNASNQCSAWSKPLNQFCEFDRC